MLSVRGNFLRKVEFFAQIRGASLKRSGSHLPVLGRKDAHLLLKHPAHVFGIRKAGHGGDPGQVQRGAQKQSLHLFHLDAPQILREGKAGLLFILAAQIFR